MDKVEKYFFERIPEIEKVEKFIAELKALDLSKISVEDLKTLIEDNIPIINYGEVFWDSRYYIFRVRRNFKNGYEPYKSLCNIGLPPASHTPFNRANNEFQPVFYGSHQGDLSLFESCQNIPEENRFEPQNFTMGIWKVKENMKLRLVPIIDSETVHQNREDLKNLSHKQQLLSNKGFTNEKVIAYNKLVSKFFADEFAKANIKNSAEYKISSYFSTAVREMNNFSHDKFDGIIYPSVAYKFKGENVAIFPESLHKLEPVKCLSVVAYNFKFEERTLVKGILAKGKVLENEEIMWTENNHYC